MHGVAAAFALALLACSSGDKRSDEARIAPWVDGFDAAKVDGPALRSSRSLGCVLEAGIKEGDELEMLDALAIEAPPVVVVAAATALYERTQVRDQVLIAGGNLADRGEVAAARSLFELGRVAENPFFSERLIRVGLSDEISGARLLPDLRELAVAGKVAEATRAYDQQVNPQELAPHQAEHHALALAALGRDEEAEVATRAAHPEMVKSIRVARATLALRLRRGVAEAIQALIADRAARGRDYYADTSALRHVAVFARSLGLAAAAAPYRRALLEELQTTPLDADGAVYLVWSLADEVQALGDPTERKLLAPLLDALPRDDAKRHVAATAALHRGPFEQAIAAVAAADDPRLWMRLWVRLAVQGHDPALDALLASACAARGKK